MGIEECVAPANDEVVQTGVDRIEAGNLLATLGDQNLHVVTLLQISSVSRYAGSKSAWGRFR
jgi:hypothetical protein